MNGKTAILAVIVVAIVCAAGVLYVSNDKGADNGNSDAAGNSLDAEYDCERIVTVGVGSLRWMSYFGLENRVVCIDAGDANSSSWNGKGYRALYQLDAGFVNSITSSMSPTEADYNEYGMAVHDHNGFSTGNLETIRGWSDENRPTIMVVAKDAYDNMSKELVKGIKMTMDMIVIHKVETFLDGSFNLSGEFEKNLNIIGKVFDEQYRANELRATVKYFVNDIKALIADKTPVIDNAYIAGASYSGSKGLTSSVESYLPFQLAGITNVMNGSDTTARDYGSEVLSNRDPGIIFLDLSGTTKYYDSTSQGVLEYAEQHNTPMYTLLPYFWFGYNFDNALANAYMIVYACYDGVLDYNTCMAKIYNVFKGFYPNIAYGSDCVNGMMDNYYSDKGSTLVLDGEELKVVDGKIVKA